FLAKRYPRPQESESPGGLIPVVEEESCRIVSPDGSFDKALDPRLPEKDLLAVYRGMLLVRTLDNRMLSLQRQGRIGFYVPSTGQEACQIGGRLPLKKAAGVCPA